VTVTVTFRIGVKHLAWICSPTAELSLSCSVTFTARSSFDLQYVGFFFCMGVGIDDTFKIAARARVCQDLDGVTRQYVTASKMLHTMMSCQTNQVAGLQWLDSKDASVKAVLLHELFAQQKLLPAAFYCKYVVTDNAAQDDRLVRDACVHCGIAPAAVGEDCWHIQHEAHN
jgi:hypothetical protein